MNENHFGKKYVRSPNETWHIGYANIYKYVRPNTWEQYRISGKEFIPTGDIVSNLEILVYLSNGAKFVNQPKGLK